DAKVGAAGDLILCSHVFYYNDDSEWLPNLERLVSCLSSSGVLVLVVQNHDTDCMRMLEHFFGRRFLLASFARQFQKGCGESYQVLVETVPAQIETTDFASAYTIAEFMLNLLPISDPPARGALEEYVRARFERAKGSFRFSCDQAAGRARERRGERLQVRDRPIDAVARWRVWVDVGKQAFEVRPPLRTPGLREGEEELLLCGERSGLGRDGRASPRSAIGRVGQLQAALVGDVLTQCELAVDVLISYRDVRVELPHQACGALGEGLRHRGCP